jgi:energy-coupling factor transporter ATP-binding protein EcfA2
MADITNDLASWLNQQPRWLQLLAKKLITTGTVSNNDFSEAVNLLKGMEPTIPINFEWERFSVAPSTAALKLTSISDVQGIENLSPRTPLQLGIGNLTVVYGHNGSGKSGYTRLLKKACGKPRALDLKSNVFLPEPQQRSCRISFIWGTEEKTIVWPANSPAIQELTAVDIFDNDEATNYLTKENNASYIPPLVALFEKLAEVCEQLKASLQTEQNQLTSKLPSLPHDFLSTEPGSLYTSLHSNLNAQRIQNYLNWSTENESELALTVKRLNTDDPAALAVQIKNRKIAVDNLITPIKNVSVLLSSDKLIHLRTLRNTAIEKRRIAIEVGNVATAKLEGVGTKTWLAMWEAARQYSAIAYPKQNFPVNDTEDSRCVLCHQKLDDSSRKRLDDFEAYVKGQLELAAQTAELAYSTALNSLTSPPSPEQLNMQLSAAGLASDDWQRFLIHVWQEYQKCRNALLNHESTGTILFSVDLAETISALNAYSTQLEIEYNQLYEDAKQFDRQSTTNQKKTLEAHKWVSQQKEAVKAELVRLTQFKQFETWKDQLNPRKLTMKAGELSEALITKAYVSRFNFELKKLGAERIQVELVKTRATKGSVLHQLKLKGAQRQKVSPESVLSEGERRIISLAAFLADVSDKPIAAPFIFDDPISSLDHDFEWYVANRLVELATKRQVLIFTHRLSLYGALEDVAKKMGDKWKKEQFTQICIEKYEGVSGQPVNQAVWNSKTETANNILIDRLHQAKKIGQEYGADSYKALAQGICSDFRKLLERTVEEDLLFEIIKRHRKSVTTDNKLAGLHVINPSDCSFIDGLMTKYSFYEHSQSQEQPTFIPTPEELRIDLEVLQNWRRDFVERRRKALSGTPTSNK